MELSHGRNPARLSSPPARALALLAAAAIALALSACLAQDKSDKNLRNGGMTPPWDSAHFTPKRLDGYAYDGPESTFSVFTAIAALDSAAGNHKDWKADPKAVDTLRIDQLFDTSFIFPQNPEAIMAYGYDDSFRDDTLFRNAYGNGLFTQDHPCAATYILSGQFLHPARWLRTGLKQDQIMEALGKPLYRQPGVLRYLSEHPSAEADSAAGSEDTSSTIKDMNAFEVFEGVNFYFRNDSLFAAVLQRSQPCH
jgi:hypothetical protein